MIFIEHCERCYVSEETGRHINICDLDGVTYMLCDQCKKDVINFINKGVLLI